MKEPLLCTWDGWSDQLVGLIGKYAETGDEFPPPFKALPGLERRNRVGLPQWIPWTFYAPTWKRWPRNPAANAPPVGRGLNGCAPSWNGFVPVRPSFPTWMRFVRWQALFLNPPAVMWDGALSKPTLEILDRYADEFAATVKEKTGGQQTIVRRCGNSAVYQRLSFQCGYSGLCRRYPHGQF